MSNVFHLDSVYLSGLATFGGGLAHVFLVFIIPHTFTWYSIYASIYGLCSGKCILKYCTLENKL